MRLIYALLGATVTLATAEALGTLIIRKLSLSLYRLEERLLAIVLGSACLSAIVFALCTVELARKGMYLVLGLLVIISAVRSGAYHAQRKPFSASHRIWESLFVVVFMALSAVYVYRDLSPEVKLGDITQHLSTLDRARGFQSGITLPEITQLLLLPAFALGRDSAAALVNWGLLASMILLMVCYGQRVGHRIVGAVVAIIVYALPLAGKYYPLQNIDPKMAIALFALFYLLQLWDSQHSVQLAIPIGILTGFSSAANRQSIMAIPYAIGLLAWKLWRERKPVIRPVLTASVLALAFIGPWVVQGRLWGTKLISRVANVPLNPRDLLLLVAIGAPLVVLALSLPPGRQLLLAASALTLPYFANSDPRFLAVAGPFALLALGMALTSLPLLMRSAALGTKRAVIGAEGALHAAFRMPGADPNDPSASAICGYRIPIWFKRLVGAGFVLAYFIYFARDGLYAHFIHDDPANIAYYWSRGVWPLIRAQFEFFSTYLRPMGGLFYLPIYHFAGFNPLPYRAVGLSLLLLNTALFYRVAKLVSDSERVAWLAAILVCCHPQLMDMIYQNSNIYDVLCFGFYFAALAWYLGIRTRDQFLNWRQIAAFVAIYVCALDSKEMAVTLPVTLALFELLFHPPRGIAPKVGLTWLNREGRVTCVAASFTAIYLIGKTFGSDPLIAVPAYHPELTVWKFMTSITGNIQTLFYLPEWFGPAYVVCAVAALLTFAWVRRSRFVAFCVLFAILSELPIAFIGRSGSCLYIPLAAWAMLVSAAVWAAARLVASVFRDRTVRLVVEGALAAVFVFLNARQVWSETQRVRPFFYDTQAATWSVIQQFARLKINPQRGAKIAFFHDPLPSPTTAYLAQLRFQDPGLRVLLNAGPPMERDFSMMDYIFDCRDGKFIQIKPPQ
jgi:hypothetical protein